MQHHPSSWYLPWGVSLMNQKMVPMHFQHPNGAPAPAIAPYPPTHAMANGTLGGGGAVTCQVLPNQAQHHSPNSAAVAAAMQAQTAPHNYQHPALHPAAAGQLTVGAYNCAPNAAGSLPTAVSHSSMLGGLSNSTQMHNPHMAAAAAQNGQMQPAPHAAHLHPAALAATALFNSPLSLRTFLASATNPLAGLTPHQQMTSCGPALHQQSANVAAANAVAAAVAAQQMTCMPASSSPQHQQQLLSHQQQLPTQQSPHQQQQQLQQQQQQSALLQHPHHALHHQQLPPSAINLNVGVVAMRNHAAKNGLTTANNILPMPIKKLSSSSEKDRQKLQNPEKRKADDLDVKDLKKAKLETKALKAKRPGFTDERYHETSYYIENGLRKVYPYYFTFTTFTKGRWVGEKILDVFAREFRAHPAEEYERCITAGTLTVNYEKVPIDYRLKHNDLLANIVHRHEVPVTSQPITIVHMDDDIVVVNKPASIPVHPCGRYRHNTVVFILAKEYNLKNLRTIHRLDRLTSGLLLFGRSPKKARQMEHQIRNRLVQKEYICRVDGNFPEGIIECKEPIEVVSYKIGVCKVSAKGKDCTTTFEKIAHNGKTSVVLCKPLTGRMHQIRVHLQYLGYPVVNDPLYNHEVFGPLKGRGGDIGGKTDEELVRDLINIHNAENWLGIDGDSDISLFKSIKNDLDTDTISLGSGSKGVNTLSDDDSEIVSREASPCAESPQPATTTTTTTNGMENSFINNMDNVVGEPAAKDEQQQLMNYSGSILVGNGSGGLASNANSHGKVEVTVATQTGHEVPDMNFNSEKLTADKHCYECKVRYRDPKPKDLIMYLHAWKYKGPGWEYETPLPNWAGNDWREPESE